MAIWIALAVVFIALFPALMSARKRASGMHDRTRDGGSDSESGSDSSDCGDSGGDGGD